MEKKTENTPNPSLRRFLQIFVPGVTGLVMAVGAACRKVLSPDVQSAEDVQTAREIMGDCLEKMKDPPPAIKDGEQSGRYTVTFTVAFPELTKVSDNAIHLAKENYNKVERIHKSQILSFQRTDDRSFNVTMEFYPSR